MDPSTNKKYLFLSDAHLGGFTEAKNNKIEDELIHLIDYCQEHDYQIILLGDLLDYWMEYPGYIPELGKKLLQRFKEYNQSFRETIFITGNHDNWTNGYLDSLGFDMEKNSRIINIGNSKVLLLHGDGLDDPSLNLPRPVFHRLLRHKSFIFFYQAVFPPKVGIALMRKFSRFTRSLESYRLTGGKLDSWAEQQLRVRNHNVTICGHDHSPRKITYDSGTFINLGTFYKHRTVATYNKGQFDLVIWSDKSRELKPFQPSPEADE